MHASHTQRIFFSSWQDKAPLEYKPRTLKVKLCFRPSVCFAAVSRYSSTSCSSALKRAIGRKGIAPTATFETLESSPAGLRPSFPARYRAPGSGAQVPWRRLSNDILIPMHHAQTHKTATGENFFLRKLSLSSCSLILLTLTASGFPDEEQAAVISLAQC